MNNNLTRKFSDVDGIFCATVAGGLEILSVLTTICGCTIDVSSNVSSTKLALFLFLIRTSWNALIHPKNDKSTNNTKIQKIHPLIRLNTSLGKLRTLRLITMFFFSSTCCLHAELWCRKKKKKRRNGRGRLNCHSKKEDKEIHV